MIKHITLAFIVLISLQSNLFSQPTEATINIESDKRLNNISIELPVPRQQYSHYLSEYGNFGLKYGRMLIDNRLELQTGFEYWYDNEWSAKMYIIPVGISFYPIGSRFLLDLYIGGLFMHSTYTDNADNLSSTYRKGYGADMQFGLGLAVRPVWNNITLNVRENIYTRFNGSINARLSFGIGYQF